MEILGGVVLRPRLADVELEYTHSALKFDIEDIGTRPDQEVVMTKAVHTAAFSNNTLGLPKVYPLENVKTINRETILNYLSSSYSRQARLAKIET